MNLPNKLTVLENDPYCSLLSSFSFSEGRGVDEMGRARSFLRGILTDMLDGKIARMYNLVADFGKCMGALADKLLVCSALICLVDLGRLPSWICIIIIAREFVISGFRLIASDNGIVIAASWWGERRRPSARWRWSFS